MHKAYIYTILIALFSFFPAVGQAEDTLRSNNGQTIVVENVDNNAPVNAEKAPESATTAENSDKVEMADGLRAEGKIYVVVLVLATIFAGIIWLLVRMDRKITRLENETKK